MSRRIAFVTDPLDQMSSAIHKNKTTLALIRAAQERGHQLFWMEASDLHIKHSQPVGYMAPLSIAEEGDDPLALGESFLAPLEKLDVVWWRKQPPYDLDMLLALDALQMLSPSTLVINHPRSLRHFNEQLLPLHFARWHPPSLVTKHPQAIRAFLSEAGGKALLRSLHAPPSQSSFFLRVGDPNLKLLIENLTQDGRQYVLVQKLVTESGLDGDKRIFLLQGEFLGIALQIPAIGEMRGSFDRGSEAATVSLSEKDQHLIRMLGPWLKKEGIFFATLDVSDGLLMDLNLSCPVGLPELQQISPSDIFGLVFQKLEENLAAR